MRVLRISSIRAAAKLSLSVGFSPRRLCFFHEPDELDFEDNIYSEHFVTSPHLVARLRESAFALEQATEKLRVPCYLKDDPEDTSTRNCSANLALAEELGGHHPTIRSLMDAFKVDLNDAVDERTLFRCLHCQTFYSGPLQILERMELECAAKASEGDGFRCKPVPVSFHDLFRRVANLWAKRLMYKTRISL